MGEHLDGLLHAMTGALGRLFGVLVSLLPIGASTVQMEVDVMQWVPFSVNHVQFSIQSILALLGGLTSIVFAWAQILVMRDKQRKASQEAAVEP